MGKNQEIADAEKPCIRSQLQSNRFTVRSQTLKSSTSPVKVREGIEGQARPMRPPNEEGVQ